MLAKKRKRRHQLPDTQLAKVFNFTSEDLAANRLGFITGEQKLNMPVSMRVFSRGVFGLLPIRQRDNVKHLCGNLRLKRIKIISDNEHLNYDTRRYIVSVSDNKLRFNISEEQHGALMPYKGKLQHIYYWSDGESNLRIVAIEGAKHAY